MSRSHTPHLLLIDGNNLAHHLYPHLKPRQKMTSAETALLLEHLSSYARNFMVNLSLELCLDRAPHTLPILPENLRVLAAAYPQIADDVLLGQFWFHHYQKRDCLAVTNDGDVLEEIQQAGGRSLRVYDFVRRVGSTNPVFLGPDELPNHLPVNPVEEAVSPRSLRASIYFRITEARKTVHKSHPGAQPTRLQNHSNDSSGSPGEKALVAGTISEFIQPQHKAADRESVTPEKAAASPPAEAEDSGPYYFLNLDNEPVLEGARFLRGAFCTAHRAAYSDLINAFDPSMMNRADLRALAGLLLDACGAEDDFTRRGSLMDRARQALLLAGDEPLSLRALAQTTEVAQSRLRQKIRAKGRGWIVTVDD